MIRRIGQWLLIGVMLVAIGGISGRVYLSWQNNHREAATTAQYQEHLDDTTQEVEDLKEELDRLRTEDSYYEQLIREELGWVKDGEVIYIIDDKS